MRKVQEIVANLKKDPVIARGTAEGLLRALQYDGFAGLTHVGSPNLGPRQDAKDGEAHREAAKHDSLLNVVITHLVHYGINNRRANEEGHDKFINTLTNVLLIYVRTGSEFARHFLEYYPECIVMLLELCSTKGANVLADQGIVHSALQIIQTLCANVKRALVLLRSEEGVQQLLALLNSMNEKNRVFKSPNLVEVLLEVLSMAVTRTDSLTVMAKANGVHLLYDIAKQDPPNGIFVGLLTLFEAIFKSDRIVKQAIEAGFVHWLLCSLKKAEIAHVPYLLRHLKEMVRVLIGYRAFMSEGGIDALLPHLAPHFSDSSTVQATCGLLFELQKQCSAIGGDAYVDMYNLSASGFTVDLPDTLEGNEDTFNPFDMCMELWDPCAPSTAQRVAELRAAVRSAPIRTLAKFCCTGPVVEPEASRMGGMEELYHPSDGLRVESMHNCFKRLLHATENSTSVGTVIYDRQALENRTGTEGSQIYAPSPRSASHLPRFHDDTGLQPLKFSRTLRLSEPNPRSGLPWSDPSFFLRRTLSCPAKMSSRLPQGLPTLRFDSRFESGNLHRAIQVGEAEYDLILSTDVNSRGYTQWFYFLVQNGLPGHTYKFNIINLEKSDSVFSEGMKPCVFSSEAFLRSGKGWTHDMSAHNICYHRNYFRRPYDRVNGKQSTLTRPKKMKRNSCLDTDEEETGNEEGKDVIVGNSNGVGGEKKRKKKIVKKKRRKDGEDPDYFFTLSFSVTFTYANDTVYYAYSYPFTFSYLRTYLDFIEVNSGSDVIRRQPLSFTRGGNLVELLTITEFPTHTSQLEEVRKRPLVVLTSRVHPGETNASWLMKGFLDWICGSSIEAIELRKKIVFKIVPMLNPDGVIEGNYRCNLAGLDLNRCWSAPTAELSPAIHATKRMIHAVCKPVVGVVEKDDNRSLWRSLLFMCDIHGHSKMKDFCLYGCDWKLCGPEFWPNRMVGVAQSNSTNGLPPPRLPPGCLPLYLGAERIFPYLLSQRAPHLFSFSHCKYNVTDDKASTARAVLWQELEISQCFTLETTFCTTSKPPLQGFHLSQFHFEEMGMCLGRALSDLTAPRLLESLVEPSLDRILTLQTLIDAALQAEVEATSEAPADSHFSQDEKKGERTPLSNGMQDDTRGRRWSVDLVLPPPSSLHNLRTPLPTGHS